MMTMNSGDWVKIILALSVLVVMFGLIINIIVHGKDWVYSEIGVTALAGVMGAIVGVLGNSISVAGDDDEKDDDDSED